MIQIQYIEYGENLPFHIKSFEFAYDARNYLLSLLKMSNIGCDYWALFPCCVEHKQYNVIKYGKIEQNLRQLLLPVNWAFDQMSQPSFKLDAKFILCYKEFKTRKEAEEWLSMEKTKYVNNGNRTATGQG